MTPRRTVTGALSRRRLLGVAGGSLAAAAVSGCTHRSAEPPAGVTRHRYGSLEDQFGDLYLPRGRARGTVVVLHGGFWLSDYALDLMVPVSRALQHDGFAVWNLEYRRLGAGGGFPATFEDTAAGIDHLTGLRGADLRRTVLLGHSAGGHLAAWAASRTAATPGGRPHTHPVGVVSLSGVLDLVAGARDHLGNGAVQELMGGDPGRVPDHYRLGDPTLLLPAAAPLVAVRGRDDDIVPAGQSTGYVAAARRAGAEAVLHTVPGDHFTIIDPEHESWPTTLAAVRSLARRGG